MAIHAQQCAKLFVIQQKCFALEELTQTTVNYRIFVYPLTDHQEQMAVHAHRSVQLFVLSTKRIVPEELMTTTVQ